MNSVLAERHFIAHLHVLFPFDGDRDIVTQSCYLVDEPRLAYIEDACNSAAAKHSRKQQQDAGTLAEDAGTLAEDAETLAEVSCGLQLICSACKVK